MKIRFLNNINTLEELKTIYRKLAFKFHPDHGGNAEDMKQLNNEYDYLSTILKDKNGNFETVETREIFKKVINDLLKIADIYKQLEIVVKGSWIWIYGVTSNKEDEELRTALKTLKCFFNNKRLCWNWKSPEDTGKHRSKMTEAEIDAKHGKQVIKKGSKGYKLQLT